MRGNSKVESNDSPEIPDRGGDIRHPRPPFGVRRRRKMGGRKHKKKKKTPIN